MNLLQNIKKKYIFIIALLLLLILAMIILLIGKQKPPLQSVPPIIIFNPSPTPQSFKGKIYPDLISITGITKDETLKNRPDLKNVTVLSNDKIQYTYKSKLDARDNMVVTQSGVAVFERFIKIEENLEKYPLGYYEKIYGSPEREILGSKFYGVTYTTYIFANKGIALIGDAKSGDIVEVQTFMPTSVDTYLKQWGEDIKPYTGEPLSP